MRSATVPNFHMGQVMDLLLLLLAKSLKDGIMELDMGYLLVPQE